MQVENGQKNGLQSSSETRPAADSTRERLLTVAEDLFAKKGFAGTSIREIGAALGIANSSIMYYFPTKEKLYAAVLKRIADSILPVTRDLSRDSGDAQEQVRVMVGGIMAWANENPGYLRIILRELMENPDRIASAKSWYLAGVVEAMRLPLDKIKSQGKLCTSDPALFLIHLVGSITYFSVALPTIGQITENKDPGELYRRYRETVFHVIDSCLAADPE